MKKSSTIVLGLTGSIGMGKTTTAKMFAKYGIPVWEADTSVHKLYSKEGEAVELFKEKLPSSIVNNEVSRAELKKLINDDERNLKTIETLIHPLVSNDRKRFVKAAAKKNIPLIVLDIPLLFEKGHEKSVDYIAVVSVKKETQIKRVLKRNTMTPVMVEKILGIQMSDAEKRQKADFVIITDTLEQAEIKVLEIITKLKDI
ncbi:MAG: dephospho-CoA kinase [Rhodobacteraceae bacterium]|nr:dephospho-CoA kinase [Paracoccaceae bacterium]